MKTMQLLEGGTVTKGIRTEIINALAMTILQHKKTPTSNVRCKHILFILFLYYQEYTSVSLQLVQQYPVLKDTVYVSETCQVCNINY